MYWSHTDKFSKKLDEKHVTGNKTFWKTAKPFHWGKAVNSLKIRLVEKDEIKNNEEKFAKPFNTFFTNIASNLRIPPDQGTDFVGGIDPVVGDDPISFGKI